MKARKENKVYSITTDQERQRYLKQGYDIYSDDGKLMEYSPQKKISYGEYDALRKENDALKGENDILRRENDALREENDALREENAALKEGKALQGEAAMEADAGKGRPESGKKAGK